jgi:protein-S-isoprenylcysteine O-methyltransferase Ste14
MATGDLVRTALWLIALGAILFVAAGELDWPQAWVFMAENVVSSVVVGSWLARHDPALLKARTSRSFHKDQKPWDRIFMVVAMLAFVGWLVLIAMDAKRFGWSHTPVWTQGLGFGLIALCMVLVWQVFRYNSFAAPQVRMQTERGQIVVTQGPYRIVRHPMYAAALAYFLGAPLLLGSLWGLVAIPVFMAAFGARAIGEERMLRQSLVGYDDYARRVRYRLIPGLW